MNECMDEWMNECKWMYGWMSEWMNEWKTNEQINGCVNIEFQWKLYYSINNPFQTQNHDCITLVTQIT